LGVLPRSDVIQKEAALQSLNTQTAMSEERVRPAQGSAQNQGASNAP
jgi:hypothetical protein